MHGPNFSYKSGMVFGAIVGSLIFCVSTALPLEQVFVKCGSVVGPNETGVLLQDITCPGDNPAIKVVGPATLNLFSHTVDCQDVTAGVVGIHVEGERATVRNGTVTGCHDGVVIGGAGNHRIVRLNSIKNDNDGFDNLPGSDGNTFISNLAQGNLSSTNPSSTDDGFQIIVSRNHKFYFNISQDNGQGWDVQGTGHLFSGNVAQENLTEGFEFRVDNNRLTNNIASSNGESGFKLVSSDENILNRNIATNNGESGIEIFFGSENNSIKKNVALGNATKNGGFDLRDRTPNCDNNKWIRNKFGTADPADCIR